MCGDGLTLPAPARSVVTAPVVDVVDRFEHLVVIAAVGHSRVEVARPLPALRSCRWHTYFWFFVHGMDEVVIPDWGHWLTRLSWCDENFL